MSSGVDLKGLYGLRKYVTRYFTLFGNNEFEAILADLRSKPCFSAEYLKASTNYYFKDGRENFPTNMCHSFGMNHFKRKSL